MRMTTIILQIKKTNDEMEELTEMSVNRKIEDRITRKLLAVIFVFAIKSILNFIFLWGFSSTNNNIFSSLFDLSTVLNCGANMIIYVIFDKRFRNMICSRFTNEEKTTVSTIMSTN